jgi:maltose O-acetyltransferase
MMSHDKYSQTVMQLMFDYESMTKEHIIASIRRLPRKQVRWLGTNHPDNRTRKLFFRETGVSIGSGVNITPGLIINDAYSGLVRIGDRVSIATNVTIVADSNPNNSMLNDESYVKNNLIVTAPVVIENDAWVGTNAVLLPGVTIGCGSIIGAGAVVNLDVPPFSVAAGVPAKVIRKLTKSTLMKNLQDSPSD